MKEPDKPAAITRLTWFEKNPKKTWLIIFVLILLFTEAALRIINPPIFIFLTDFSKIFDVHPRWISDLKPNSTAHIVLDKPPLNFLVTINKFGFRDYDRPVDHYPGMDVESLPKDKWSFIHAIGDSFTMGWGGNYEASYPAILNSMLSGVQVLNLGVPGFGTIGATEKSLALWDKFPASQVIYFFCDNDPDDDAKSITNLEYYLKYFSYRLRSHSYLGSLPYIIKWYFYYKNSSKVFDYDEEYHGLRHSALPPDAVMKIPSLDLPADSSTAAEENMTRIKNSVAYLEKYHDFVKKNGARLVVIALDSPRARIFREQCLTLGIEVVIFKIPEGAVMRGEGHLNEFGNYIVASMVARMIKNDFHPSR
ncbi:MAG: hypothetical protein HQK55_00085 [Deltaproteobacteria bacterium]|nr:hypothetical protein [Deltaproteobacteria bacterium]